MSGLSYFHDVWKDSAGRISFQKFEEKFDELYKESLNIEDLIFLLFTASRLFSQKRNGGDSFRTPQDWYNARAYFCKKMRICGEQLQIEEADYFKPRSLVLLIKAYNMMQIHPSLEMQNLLVRRSQDVFEQISFGAVPDNS